ncbi:hypothetical protein D3C85_1104480 [compost metagenome]
MRPKPYRTTSVPSRAAPFCLPTTSASSSLVNCSMLRPLPSALNLATILPRSTEAAPSLSSLMALRMGKVSWTDSSASSARR